MRKKRSIWPFPLPTTFYLITFLHRHPFTPYLIWNAERRECTWEEWKPATHPLSVPPPVLQNVSICLCWWKVLRSAGHRPQVCSSFPTLAFAYVRAKNRIVSLSRLFCLFIYGSFTIHTTCKLAFIFLSCRFIFVYWREMFMLLYAKSDNWTIYWCRCSYYYFLVTLYYIYLD